MPTIRLNTPTPTPGQTWRPFAKHRSALDTLAHDTANGRMRCLDLSTQSEVFVRPRTLRKKYSLERGFVARVAPKKPAASTTPPPLPITQVRHNRFRVGAHEGYVRGLGGLVSTLYQLQRAQRIARAGRGPAHVTMLPEYSAQSDGPALRVSLLTGEVSP